MLYVNGIEKEEKKSPVLKQEILDKMVSLITTSFSLVAALTWNDTIKIIFKEIIGISDTIESMLLYAVIVTVIVVILTIIVTHPASRVKSMMGKKYLFVNYAIMNQRLRQRF